MGISQELLHGGILALAARDPAVARAVERCGLPEPRLRQRGHATLLRTIVGQQVSVAAAASMWRKLADVVGETPDPAVLLAADFDTLRACGLSRQKQGYARSLCELVVAGELDLTALPTDDEEAIALLTRVKGIGRWSAEIYLLFAEGRADVWPAGDLGVQAGLHRILALPERPSEKETRALGEHFTPHRGAMAIFTWHCYDNPAL
jgi:DNA-3-methyladenine glycosylase II